VTFSQAVRSVLSNYANFQGRSGRAEYWWWVLAVLIISIATQAVDALVMPAGQFGGGPVSAIVGLALIVPNLSVAVRRLHDTGRTGWWILLLLIPVIGLVVLIFFYLQPGEDGPNRFGPPPAR
jgi:uncharacterized membrane protein YhaH (DUF805 family)